jgi:hypothetical protein
MVQNAIYRGRTPFTAGASTSLALAAAHVLRPLGGQQQGSSSNLPRPHETSRVTATASVEWPVMRGRGFVGAGLPAFLDGMQAVRRSKLRSHQESRERLPGALIEIDVRAGVSGRLTAEDQLNALVKPLNALPTVGPSRARSPSIGGKKRLQKPCSGGCGGRGRS